jgi:hypothetical protein
MKTNQTIRNQGSSIPEPLRAFDLGKLNLSCSAPEVAGYTDAIIDVGRQPKPDDLVLGVISGEKAIRRFSQTTKDDHIIGVVTQLGTWARL